eukprot:3151432-Amphidinium_carterae.1
MISLLEARKRLGVRGFLMALDRLKRYPSCPIICSEDPLCFRSVPSLSSVPCFREAATIGELLQHVRYLAAHGCDVVVFCGLEIASS